MITTIIAPATAMVPGAIGIVRLSGPKALEIAKQITSCQNIEPRYAHFVDVGCGELIDKAILIYFKGPASFTGEDVVEIHLHGNPLVLTDVISLGVQFGATMADPGEFSKRAFLNGKMSLDQVEAIADLIHAKSAKAARSAALSLDGALKACVDHFQSRLMALRVLLEAAIDFAEEDIPTLTPEHLEKELKLLQREITSLHARSQQGAALAKGICICLVGRPNAGKSTLMNLICQKKVSIVTAEAGTTRDIIEREVVYKGHSMMFLDTAGLRSTSNQAEAQGVALATQALKNADLVLHLMDVTDPGHEDIQTEAPVWTVFNKVDLLQIKPTSKSNVFQISAKEETGVELLLDAIVALQNKTEVGEAPFSARQRHVSILHRAKESLMRIDAEIEVELLAQHLYDIQEVLSEITGAVTCDDVLGEIFADFCIGK